MSWIFSRACRKNPVTPMQSFLMWLYCTCYNTVHSLWTLALQGGISALRVKKKNRTKDSLNSLSLCTNTLLVLQVNTFKKNKKQQLVYFNHLTNLTVLFIQQNQSHRKDDSTITKREIFEYFGWILVFW